MRICAPDYMYIVSDGFYHKIGELSGWRWGICTAGADKRSRAVLWPLHECEGTTLHPTEKQKCTYHGRISFPSGKLPRQAA
jgi:hypothetical protein